MFGTIVRAQRLRLGLTQEELGERATLSVRSIGKIEGNKIAAPRMHTVRLLADAFGLTDDERDQFLRAAVKAPAPRSHQGGESQHAPVRVVPAQLPADVRAFTGRATELARLDELLDAQRSSMPTRESADTAGLVPMVIAVVSGTAGVGKTALAVHWAHRVRDQFPDGQLYVDLRGYDPQQPMSAAESLNSLLTAFGVLSQDVPLNLAERASRYRTELAGRRVLVVLDNASSVEQVRSLLPGTSSSMVLVTSRDSLSGLVAREGAERVELDLLPSEDAHSLLRRLIGARATNAPTTVAKLASLCARLPLALRVAAELAITRPTAPLDDLAVELADQQHLLDLLDAGGDPRTGVCTVFSWSMRNLPVGPARVFPLVGLHPGPTFERHAVAAMAATTAHDAGAALTVLTRAHLVQPVGSDRFAMHDLLRAYAVQLAAEQAGATAGTGPYAATGRLLDHYLHTAFAADRWLNPHRRPITLAPARVGDTAALPDDYASAVAWFRAEEHTIAAATRFALDNGWYVHAWQLPWTCVNYLHMHGKWSEWISLHLDALDASRRLADRNAQARTLHSLARAYNEFGDHEQAHLHYREALDLYIADGKANGTANSLNGLSGCCLRLGRLDDAVRFAMNALDTYIELADRIGQGSTLNLLGRIHSALDQRATAIAYHRRAFTIFLEVRDIYGQANTLGALGETLRRMGRTMPAAVCHNRSIGLHEIIGNRYSLAVAHQRLAESLCELGQRGAAQAHHERAHSIFDELGRSAPSQGGDSLPTCTH
jgi:tetratricopeptide (TPR) repeat protein/transcriptional regulator with XRE-family HTH domain